MHHNANLKNVVAQRLQHQKRIAQNQIIWFYATYNLIISAALQIKIPWDHDAVLLAHTVQHCGIACLWKLRLDKLSFEKMFKNGTVNLCLS